MKNTLPASAVERTYLLVHPERFPSNDVLAIAPPNYEYEIDYPLFDEQYGQGINDVAATCQRRIAFLDEIDYLDFSHVLEGDEDFLDDELTVGVPPDGWELVLCPPSDVGRMVRKKFASYTGEVIVGGYNRYDCVRRACMALSKLGIRVAVHEAGTLPLAGRPYSGKVSRQKGNWAEGLCWTIDIY